MRFFIYSVLAFAHATSVSSFETKHNTTKTAPFAVNGSALPDVHFDVGESYAGLLPISKNPEEELKLYFWYFVSQNALAGDEILIWLNGGPGASSLEGLLQENGPFLWQFGTFAPVPNPWTWVNETNVVWIEQPISTGFSGGGRNGTASSEEEMAQQFLAFWQNFIDTFDMHGRKVFMAGESYAGMYIPYIADAMFDAAIKETNGMNGSVSDYFNLEATLIYDPFINSNAVGRQISAVAFAQHWSNMLGLNDTFMTNLTRRADKCGYTSFLEEYLKYPPPNGTIPTAPTYESFEDSVESLETSECNLYRAIVEAATLINPCFNIYQISTTCPLLWDVLGFPGSFLYSPPGASIYFDRPEVKRAINAPQIPWSGSTDRFIYNTTSGESTNYQNGQFSSLTVLPRVIERSKRTIIGHGGLDFILQRNGTLLTIQNMTWGGLQGFQEPPNEDFFVPYHTDWQLATLAGAGVMGKTRTERGLTYFDIDLSGHMVPQFAPSAAYRSLEFLLGRVPSLTTTDPFTISDDGLIAEPPGPAAQ